MIFFQELKKYEKNEFGISDEDFPKIKKYLKEHIEQTKDKNTQKFKTIKLYSFKCVGLIYKINKLFIIYPKYMKMEIYENKSINNDYKNKITTFLKSLYKYKNENKELNDKNNLDLIVNLCEKLHNEKKLNAHYLLQNILYGIKITCSPWLKKINNELNWDMTNGLLEKNKYSNKINGSKKIIKSFSNKEPKYKTVWNKFLNNINKLNKNEFTLIINQKQMEKVWEKAYLSVQKFHKKNTDKSDKNINDALSWKINKQIFISEGLKPDVVIDNNKNLYIYDLKYYDIQFDPAKLENFPNKSDIFKQYLYELAFKDKNFRVKKNSLIFPFDFSSKKNWEQIKNENHFVEIINFKNLFYYKPKQVQTKFHHKTKNTATSLKKIKIIFYDANDLFSWYVGQDENILKIYKNDCKENDFMYTQNNIEWIKSSRYTWIEFSYQIKERSEKRVKFSFAIRDIRNGYNYSKDGNISLQIPQNE